MSVSKILTTFLLVFVIIIHKTSTAAGADAGAAAAQLSSNSIDTDRREPQDNDTNTSLIAIHITHFNDFHARFDQISINSTDCLFPKECIGGFSRLVAKIRSLKSDLVFNAGDYFQGTLWYSLFKWNVTSLFLNKLHQDAMTLGNHEFDDGLEGLIPYIENSLYPILVCNIDSGDEPDFQRLQDTGKISPSKIFVVKGIRIGVIGVIIQSTNQLSRTGKLKFLDEVESVNRELKRIEKKCDSIFILSHCGLDVDRQMAAKISGKIDLIIGGHSHTLMYNGKAPNGEPTDPYPAIVMNENNNNPVLIVQASAYTKYLGDLTLFFDSTTRELAKWYAPNPIYLRHKIRRDYNMTRELKPWSRKVYQVGHRVIAYNEIDLSVENCSYAECNIGDFMADAMVNEFVNHNNSKWANLTAAVVNTGSIRTSILRGNVTYGDILTCQPFRNTVDAIEIRGSDLRTVFGTTTCRNSHSSWKSFLQISGLQLVFNSTDTNSTQADNYHSCYELMSLKIRKSLASTDDYEEVRNDDTLYRLAMPSFLAHGGDSYVVFRDRATDRFVGTEDSIVFIKYFVKLTPVRQLIDGRISIVN